MAASTAWASGFKMRIGIPLSCLESILSTLKEYPQQEVLRSEKSVPIMILLADALLADFEDASPLDSACVSFEQMSKEDQTRVRPFLNRFMNTIQDAINYLSRPFMQGRKDSESRNKCLQALELLDRCCSVYARQFGSESPEFKSAKAQYEQVSNKLYKTSKKVSGKQDIRE
jgi:hypothetical protein